MVKDKNIPPHDTTTVIQSVARLLFLPAMMTALAVLVKGYADVGDGFNAGVIAALGVLLQYVAFGDEEARRRLRIKYLPAIGFASGLLLALSTALVPLLFGKALFEHTPGAGEEVIHVGAVEIITPVAFDVGVFLLVFGFAVGAIDIIARATDASDEEDGIGDERWGADEI